MVRETKGGGIEQGGGGRRLAVKLRTAKGRKIASTRWLQRQLNDPYVEEAKRRGLRSRAAFKLIEIDDKHRILKPGMKVVDLGAAPGGWSQVAAMRVASLEGKGRAIAVDITPMEPIPGVDALALDVSDAGAAEAIATALGGGSVDVVLSDMAAPATGHRPTDHLRVVALVEAALDFAEAVLAPGGTFLAKVSHVKPKASRAESPEVYVLATGFRGAP